MTDPESSSALAALGAATVGESGGRPMSPAVKPAWPGAVLAAPVFTAHCAPGDNLAVHVAVTRAPEGSALVVDAAADPEHGFWGEVLTTAAEARGLTGLVIEGGVRDVGALAAHRFPVFSTLVALRGASKVGAGSVGSPVTVGGAHIETGDWVVGDVDGVVVVPAERLSEVLAAARARADRERVMFEDLRAGRTTVELLDLDVGALDGR